MHFQSPNLFPSPLREESPCRRGREAELRVACVFTHVIWRCCVWRLRFISDSWNFSACKLLKTETILFSHSIKSARGKSEYLKHRNLYFRFDGLVDFSFAFHWWKVGPGRCELGDSGQRTWTLHFHVPRVLSEGAVRTGWAHAACAPTCEFASSWRPRPAWGTLPSRHCHRLCWGNGHGRKCEHMTREDKRGCSRTRSETLGRVRSMADRPLNSDLGDSTAWRPQATGRGS